MSTHSESLSRYLAMLPRKPSVGGNGFHSRRLFGCPSHKQLAEKNLHGYMARDWSFSWFWGVFDGWIFTRNRAIDSRRHDVRLDYSKKQFGRLPVLMCCDRITFHQTDSMRLQRAGSFQ